MVLRVFPSRIPYSLELGAEAEVAFGPVLLNDIGTL